MNYSVHGSDKIGSGAESIIARGVFRPKSAVKKQLKNTRETDRSFPCKIVLRET